MRVFRTFKFSLRTPSSTWFLLRVARCPMGSENAGKEIVGNVTLKEVNSGRVFVYFCLTILLFACYITWPAWGGLISSITYFNIVWCWHIPVPFFFLHADISYSQVQMHGLASYWCFSPRHLPFPYRLRQGNGHPGDSLNFICFISASLEQTSI